ncbi:uncharacterized protein MELLADRAFT_101411 [Melampsora larici-populina 98AG31]|uniref:Uncharacterized protein n=1 Tax=Melampsora larici-populina (strain 98AG31 / pathotype 3-4-7) TaxID=747676 RepID=F4R4N4_MELLP|nr:uncharacterized protein MELLADRAFT_101411 [Melampsora larici-populina 98AG31]EGG12840.1 hypothetical protein MELLADRAFT_101411 [Melampsora larici-populina 98AG31]
MAFQMQLSNVVLKNLFTAGLRPEVKDRALKHPDWFKCSTIEERQAVAMMASEQIMHVSANNHLLVQSHSAHRAIAMPPAVQVPRDPNAMDVDVNAVASKHPFPPLPVGVSFGSFVKFCHNRKMCHCCLKPYDSTHKGPDGKGIGCPNLPPRTTQEIEMFMQKHRAPASNPHSSQTMVAAVDSSPQTVRSQAQRPPVQFMIPNLTNVPDVQAGFRQVPTGYQLPPHLPLYHPYQFALTSQFHHPLQHPGLPAAMGIPAAVGITDPVQQVLALFSEYQNIDQPTYYDHSGTNQLDHTPMFDPTDDGEGFSNKF